MTPPGSVRLSVIIPTRNPHPGRLQRTLAGLAAQTLARDAFEVILIDNGSVPPVSPAALAAFPTTRVVREEQPGLTAARRCGFRESRGAVLVLVDDDNVLAPDYLARVESDFAAEPELGALGGKVAPDFEQPPEAWVSEFYGLLALRDHGSLPLRAAWRDGGERSYPPFAPIGAGFAVRRALALDYSVALDSSAARRALDRTGTRLVSGGDNDLVMHVLESGASIGYDPGLALAHLIPIQRLQRAYLGALNRAIARSWVSVLALHGIRPWPPVTPSWTVPLRQWRAWWRTRAWSGPAAWVRWQGRCGTFEGQADLARRDASDASDARANSPA